MCVYVGVENGVGRGIRNFNTIIRTVEMFAKEIMPLSRLASYTKISLASN